MFAFSYNEHAMRWPPLERVARLWLRPSSLALVVSLLGLRHFLSPHIAQPHVGGSTLIIHQRPAALPPDDFHAPAPPPGIERRHSAVLASHIRIAPSTPPESTTDAPTAGAEGGAPGEQMQFSAPR